MIFAAGLMAQQRMQPLGMQSQPSQPREDSSKQLPEYPQGTAAASMQNAWQYPVSPDYLIGPGDVFDVSIVSLEKVYYQLPVSPSGDLHIPGIGIAKLDGISLSESVEIITSIIRNKFPKAGIEVSLYQMKRLKIPVTGAVIKPETYYVPGNARFSEIMAQAEVKPTARLYEVFLRHQDGTVDTLNVLQYRFTGNRDLDPELAMGDRIHIPYGTITGDIVEVTGEREELSLVSIEPGMSLEYFLNTSIRFSRDVFIGYITILRKGNTFVLNPSEYETFILEAGDRIALHRNEPVNVVGFVHLPGAYPYYPNFSVGDYLSLAGGLTKESSMKSIRVHHKDGLVSLDLRSLVQPGDVIEAKRSVQHFLVGDVNVLSLITTTASIILTWIAATK
jgi:protein involved in polysaccharide export with SLBB domain